MGSINSLGGASSAWATVGSQRGGRPPPGGGDAAAFQDKLFNKLDSDGSGGIGSDELQGLLTKLSAKAGSAVGGSDPQAAFATMDQNGDGSLDKGELDSGLKAALGALPDTVSFARARGAGGGDEAARFAQADADGSGGISADELKLAMEASPRAGGEAVAQNKVDALMAKLDADGSGEISASEMAAGKPGDGGAEAAGRAGGPPPGVGGPPPGGGGPGGGGAADDSTSSSIDPLDTNADGTVSASERAAGELKEVMQSLMKAVDSNSDGQISGGEAKRFGELLTQMAGGAESASSAGAAGQGGRPDGRASNASALADQVLRHYAQAAAATVATGVGSGLHVEA